jgi:hypothetical protein
VPAPSHADRGKTYLFGAGSGLRQKFIQGAVRRFSAYDPRKAIGERSQKIDAAAGAETDDEMKRLVGIGF